MSHPSQPPPPLRALLDEGEINYVRVGKTFARLSSAAVLGFVVWQQILDGFGLLTTYMNPNLLPLLHKLELGILAGWGLIYLGILQFERRGRQPTLGIFVVTQYFALSFVTLGYAVGTLSFAAGVFLVGAPMLGFVLVGRKFVLSGVVTALASLLGLTVASAVGLIPYAPMLVDPALPMHEISPVYALSQWIYGLPFGGAALYLSATVLAQWRERERHIMHLSITDPMTGTYNRTYGIERLREEMARARRDKSCVSVVMVDLDHFKGINDRHGHLTGDTALRRAARLLRREVRSSDVVCRYGGEEFLLVLPDTDLQGAREVAERCRIAMEAEELRSAVGARVAITASLGVARYRPEQDSDDEDRLLHTADEALYAAKSAGRNQVVLAS